MSKRVAVTASDTTVVGAREGGTATVLNYGAHTVFVGDAGLTADDGFPLVAGAAIKKDVSGSTTLHAICATGESSVLAVIF